MNVDPCAHPNFFTNVTTPKLSETQKQFCDNEITEDELFKTLKTFSKNKSPGLDENWGCDTLGGKKRAKIDWTLQTGDQLFC